MVIPPVVTHGSNAPYERVQGMAAHSNAHPQSYLPLPGPSNPFPYDQAYNAPFPTMGGWGTGLENDGSIDNLGLPSSCGCGDDCTCPGCIHHSRVAAIPSSSAYASCSNPNFLRHMHGLHHHVSPFICYPRHRLVNIRLLRCNR